MPKICYVPRRFSGSSQALIDHALTIIAEYEEQDFDLTLRQLYYQMVARDLIPNNLRSYKRLGSIVNDARLAGLIDWDRIQDLTREMRHVSHWASPEAIIGASAQSYRVDKWEGQPYRPEVWVEKDALRNVVQRVCDELDVPYFVCRGYTSQSEMWVASQRFHAHIENDQKPVVLHLGDHDPSGIDMTRDIADRLAVFGCAMKVDRLALNLDQVRKHAPPPNPAKTTDARFAGYIRRFGPESWELDALDPRSLSDIIRKAVLALRDDTVWMQRSAIESRGRDLLAKCASGWGAITEFIDHGRPKRKT